VIYHLALPAAWRQALERGSYDRSTREQSLAEVGFIHCSELDQLPRTVAKFYADLDRVVLLSIDEAGLDVRREAADGLLFPHIYSVLPVSSVVAATEFSPLAGEAAPVS
jgi:glutathione S-transferase